MTATMRFEPILEEASDWIDAVTSELGMSQKRSGYAALRATLHALRDSLDMEGAVQLGEGLPMLIRGLYYEGWASGKGLPHIHGVGDFLDSMRHALRGHAELSDPEKPARATFAALVGRLPRDAADAIARGLPSDIHQFLQRKGTPAWPEAAGTESPGA
jgi:uncharacterized protein (DUF2267 family)